MLSDFRRYYFNMFLSSTSSKLLFCHEDRNLNSQCSCCLNGLMVRLSFPQPLNISFVPSCSLLNTVIHSWPQTGVVLRFAPFFASFWKQLWTCKNPESLSGLYGPPPTFKGSLLRVYMDISPIGRPIPNPPPTDPPPIFIPTGDGSRDGSVDLELERERLRL